MDKQCGVVKDILVPLEEYPHIRVDSALRDAFDAIKHGLDTGKRFRHVLVLDAADTLVGVLGMRDIIRGVMPDFLIATLPGESRAETPIPQYPALASFWQDTFHDECKHQIIKPVTPHVLPITATVASNDPVTKAAYLMIYTGSSMLPVVDEGKVVGVVRIVDVFNAASEVVLDG